MENGLASSATTLAAILQSLFVFSIVGLTLWRVFRPSLEMITWRAWLRVWVAIGICGGLVEAVIHAVSMSEQYAIAEEDERYALTARWAGPYWWSYWGRPLSLLIMSVLLFVARKRGSWWIAWAMALLLSIPLGLLIRMITSLHRDYLPSSWTLFHPGWSALIIPATLLLSALVMLWVQRRPIGVKTTRKN